jgi:subtilisin family serine protease
LGNIPGHTAGADEYSIVFTGTSAATPLVAGIAALMLSAAPELTWMEVRDILRTTAVPIDWANIDPIGQWVDTDGDGQLDYSQWFGFGRVDACAAVTTAINRRISRRAFIALKQLWECFKALFGL